MPTRNAGWSARARISKLALPLLLLAATLLLARDASAEPNGPPMPETTMQLSDVSGRIDHMALDPHRNQLIVVALGNTTIGLFREG